MPFLSTMLLALFHEAHVLVSVWFQKIRFHLLHNHDLPNLQLAIFVRLISVYSDVNFVSSYTHIRLMIPASKIEVVLGFDINCFHIITQR